MYKCSRCFKEKPIADFYPNKHNSLKHNSCCKQCALIYGKKRREVKPNYDKDWFREKRRKKRLEVLKEMGGQCLWCGFSDPRALQVDHINGGGSSERKSGMVRGNMSKIVLNSLKNKENKFQLLCANCNWIKRFTNDEIRSA